MNVQLDHLPHCITSMRVELPSDKVTASRSLLVNEYARQVRLPGYRPGKAPKAVVEARFKKEIKEELERRLVSDAVRQAIKDHNVRALSISSPQDLEYAEDQTLSFTVSVVTSPSFDLPEYKGVSVEVPAAEVTDEAIDLYISKLRDQAADFSDVLDRAAEINDYVVISYQGTIDGKPVAEVVPAAGDTLSGGDDFWLQLTPEAFLPGFSEALVGIAVAESREFDLQIPSDFPLADLAGKTVHFRVTLDAIKQKDLPELDDAFAATVIPDKTLAELRDIVRDELGRQRERLIEREKRNRILSAILSNVECELPESHIRNETYRILTQLIEENQQRGVPDAVITANQKELLASAANTARERLKGTFVLLRIAEAEEIKVSREELERQLALIAERRNEKLEKVRKEFEREGVLDRLYEDILSAKTLDFLVSTASVSVVEPQPTAELPAESAGGEVVTETSSTEPTASEATTEAPEAEAPATGQEESK